jgi:hypothetical protein
MESRFIIVRQVIRTYPFVGATTAKEDHLWRARHVAIVGGENARSWPGEIAGTSI